jgi:hypothetical protein
VFSSFRSPQRALTRGGLVALLALLGVQSLPAPAAAATVPAQRVATVRAVTASLQKHRWPARSFTPTTQLQVGKRQWKGTNHVATWWRSQFRLGLQITLVSPVTTRSGRVEVILRRWTRTGACAAPCLDRATWRFTGAKIKKVTLTPLPKPVPGGTPGSVPTPPASSPPRGTPTIPS